MPGRDLFKLITQKECKNLFCSFWGGIRISILYISETGIKGLPYSLLETYDGFWKE